MRQNLPLNALRAFEAAARLGSLRAAANELRVTATAISHQVRTLERSCKTSLFIRRPLPLRLSPAGELLFPVVRDGLDTFAAALQELRPRASRATLRVSTTNAFASRCLVPLLPSWRQAHPDIELEIVGTDAVLDLRDGTVDIALRYARDMPVDGQAFELARDRFFVVASTALIEQTEASAALQRLPRIAYDWPPADHLAPTWTRWSAAANDDATIGTPTPLRFREELHAIEAVIAGQGIAILSDLLIRRELDQGLLLPLSDVSLDGYGIYLVTIPRHPLKKSAVLFRTWITKAITDRQAPKRYAPG